MRTLKTRILVVMTAVVMAVSSVPATAAETPYTAAVQNDAGEWAVYNGSGRVDTTMTGLYPLTVGGKSGTYYVYKGVVSSKTGLLYVDGQYRYFVKGRFDASSRLVEGWAGKDGTWYVKEGIVAKDYRGFVSTVDGRVHYIVWGKKSEETGFVTYNGAAYCLTDGVLKDETGFVKGTVDGTEGWWYVTGGKARTGYTGIVEGTLDGTKAKWYVEGGLVKTGYTGLTKASSSGAVYYVKGGKVDTSATGLKSGNGGLYYVKGGKADLTYTGFVKDGGKWYYLKDGVADGTVSSVIKDTRGTMGTKGTWWYVVGNEVQTGFTGLADYKNENGWWYIKNGKVDFTANGVYKNKNGWWYVTGGKVQKGFTGLANYKNQNGWWYIKNGKVDFTAQGIYKNKNGWYYVSGGKVRFDYTGVGSNSNGVWYVSGGKVRFSYNGTASKSGLTFKFRNSKAVSATSSLATGGSSANRATVNSRLSKVSPKILLTFAEEGGTVRLVNSVTNATGPSIMGMCTGYDIEILNTAHGADFAPIHEMGHFVDQYASVLTGGRKYTFYSDSSEFRSIMNSEIAAYRKMMPYDEIDAKVLAGSSTSEYFADAFKAYYTHNSGLKKSCPKTYAFIEKVIAMF